MSDANKMLQSIDDLLYILAHPNDYKKARDELKALLAEQQKIADEMSATNAKIVQVHKDIAEERRKLEIARGDLLREQASADAKNAETKQGVDALALARKAFDEEQASRIQTLQRERTTHLAAKKQFDEEQTRSTALLTQRARDVENRESQLESREAALAKREAAAQAVLDKAKKMAELAS